MSFCLPKNLINPFLKGIKEGQLDPAKLASMSSAERRAAFSEVVGEANAKQVNALFESKLLLKDQQQGMITWIKSVAGLKPEVKRDLVTRVNRLASVLDPEDKAAFLEDLADARLGMGVSPTEAAELVRLGKEVAEAGIKVTDVMPARSPERLAWGRAQVAFNNYANDLKFAAEKPTIGERVKGLSNVPETFSKSTGFFKSLKSTLDMSALGRQGWRAAFTNPALWGKNMAGAWVQAGKSLKGKQVLDEVMADLLSRPNANRYRQSLLATGVTEEAFPSTLPEKIPGIGKLFKASQEAYSGFLYTLRADIFDKYLEIAQRAGKDIDSKEFLRSQAKVVNSLTGRGSLGQAEPIANLANNAFFSLRFLQSNLDVVTAHLFNPTMDAYSKKVAAQNLLKIAGGMAGILAIADTVSPGSVEWNPTSPKFGQIKVGDRWYDISGGLRGIPTLASRLVWGETKSGKTGKVTPLWQRNKDGSLKFGTRTGLDLVEDFIEGKASPTGAVLISLLKGERFGGKPVTLQGLAGDLAAPINYQKVVEDAMSDDEQWADIVGSFIGEFVGFGSTDYTKD